MAMPEAKVAPGSPCLENEVIGCEKELKVNGNQKQKTVCKACF